MLEAYVSFAVITISIVIILSVHHNNITWVNWVKWVKRLHGLILEYNRTCILHGVLHNLISYVRIPK